MEFKYIIVGPQNRSLHKIIECIEAKNDNFIIAKKFINDISVKDTENEEGLYYLDNTTITSALKNNSILYIYTGHDNTTGVTIDEFYNANIISMSVADFNNISTNLINTYKDNMLIVWLDTKHHIDSNSLNKDIHEVNYLMQKINDYGYKYIYLLDENYEFISDIILDYHTADDVKKQKILEDYS